MWGYRGRFEWAGKWAARADDVLSFVPARLTAIVLALATPRWPRGLPRVAAVTPSPNGGWPMGTLALLLGVRLSKPGVYVLNPGGADVAAAEFAAGLTICTRAAWISVALGVALLLLIGSGT
jgi:adenosylcobinamide-phosphate synthase